MKVVCKQHQIRPSLNTQKRPTPLTLTKQSDCNQLGPLCRILCVDDDTTGLKLRGAILERNGYCTTLEADPIKVLSWENLDFDTAIVDFEMPGLNGLQLLQRLRARGLACPVILLSGHISFLDDDQRGHFTCCLDKCQPVADLLGCLSSLRA